VRTNDPELSREHEDPHTHGLSALVLDRQRVVHSAAFRRLQYKTQVFVALESDHYRTRLTHTLEVAHLARCLAEALGLNGDLAEVVALAHDLGHPPFGHAGEQALNECMKDHGGFEHNVHALRVVEYLEHPYPTFRGLNLTRCVRECLAKHTTQYDRPGPHPLQDGRPPPLEGQVAALADQLAYGLHDLQDGVYAELVEPEQLAALELWRSVYSGPADPAGHAWRAGLRPAIDNIQSTLIEDALAETRRRLAEHGGGRGAGPERAGVETVALSAKMEERVVELEAFLRAQVYNHERLVRMDSEARRVITAVFQAYVEQPRLMPPRFAGRVAEQGVQRVVVDYVAGMTDRFCTREHARLSTPRAGT
jgi:dGTPase